MLPIPKHLQKIFLPIGDAADEFEVTGRIICECSSENFSIEYVGESADYTSDRVIKLKEINGSYFLIVKVKCTDCSREHLIFDDHFHGWNGFVCGEEESFRKLPRPKGEIWHCKRCHRDNHSIVITINSKGQQDFIEEAEGLNEDDWVEAFSWITIGIHCKSCDEANMSWISYETM
jgi:ribosomal protein S27E